MIRLFDIEKNCVLNIALRQRKDKVPNILHYLQIQRTRSFLSCNCMNGKYVVL